MKALFLRKTMWAAGMLAAAGMLVAADLAWSQPDGGWRGRMARRGGPNAIAIPLGRLDLSDEQRDQVREVIAESREAMREAGRQVRASRRALDEAVGTGGDVDEAAIRAAAAALGVAEGAVALERASARARIWRVLTPEQRTGAEEIAAEREQRMEERRERRRERRERRRERQGGEPAP